MITTTLLALAALAVDAPVSLTTSDGSGLAMKSLEADAVCAGPLCFTELRLAFQNPEDRVIEGQFQIALPPGASVSRFAMKIDDKWQEAEVVEKQAARRAYEDFLHRRQDPALLEQAAGNQFQARVFPIPAKGIKELIVGYGHALPSSTSQYVFPLVGLPQIDKLAVKVRDGSNKVLLELAQTKVVPNKDAVVDVKGARAMRSADVVVIRAPIEFAADSSVDDTSGVVILLDTSASRALQLPKDVALVRDLVKTFAATRPVVVAAFDQTLQEIFNGPAKDFNSGAFSSRRALGATDLGMALTWAGNVVDKGRSKSPKIDRIVIVSDGVSTADLDGPLATHLAALKAKGVRRIDAIVRGGVRDEATLAQIVKGGAEEGVVVDGDVGAAALSQRLRKKTRSGIAVDVANAQWVWPKVIDAVQPGDERVIVAEVKPGAALQLKLGGQVVDVGAAVDGPAPLLKRAWAEARIARLQNAVLTARSDGEKKELKEQIVAVSIQHRVLSSETALLVLETEQDYARYGIDRKSLADILVVDANGVSLRSRSDVVIAKKPEPPKPKPRPEKTKKSRAAEGERESMKESVADAKKMDSSDMFEGEADSKPSDDVEEEAKVASAPSAPPPPPPAPSRAREPSPEVSNSPPPPAPPPPPPPASAAAEDEGPAFVNPWTGDFDVGMKLLKAGKRDEALKKARGWREENPGDVLALFLLAEVLSAPGAGRDDEEAARALGAVIDLFPSRTDLRRAVGARLDKLQLASKKANSTTEKLSIDTWRKAVEQRPDHPQSHRGLAWSLLRAGKHAEAFDVAEKAIGQRYRSDGFRGVDQILREDLGLIGKAWKANGGKNVDDRIKKAGGVEPTGPSMRFVLWWETDANDVDFHIRDGQRNHAYYSSPQLASGGRLYADVTTGYGPECFTIEGSKRAAPYKLSAHYYSRGPMGFGLGTMVVIEHDGKGGFSFDDRPFVIMVDGAYVDLGTVK